MRETWVQSLGREDPLEEGMATHSSILAWIEEPGGLQSTALQRVGHDWTIKHGYSKNRLSIFLSPYKCLLIIPQKSKHLILHQSPYIFFLLTFSSPGNSQARILEWVAMPSSRGLSQPRDWTQVFCIASEFFTVWATREAIYLFIVSIY